MATPAPTIPSPRQPDSVGPARSRARWLLPAIVVLVGLFAVMPVAGTLSGKLGSVVENDQAAFLPESAESTKSVLLEERFAGDQDIPAIVVWERADR